MILKSLPPEGKGKIGGRAGEGSKGKQFFWLAYYVVLTASKRYRKKTSYKSFSIFSISSRSKYNLIVKKLSFKLTISIENKNCVYDKIKITQHLLVRNAQSKEKIFTDWTRTKDNIIY